jgi:hypothetical protein
VTKQSGTTVSEYEDHWHSDIYTPGNSTNKASPRPVVAPSSALFLTTGNVNFSYHVSSVGSFVSYRNAEI